MAGLKTLNDAAEGDTGAAEADAGVAAGQVETEAAIDAPAQADPLDPAVAAMREERDAAVLRGDQLEADYLAQSDKLAAANAALAASGDAHREALNEAERLAGLLAEREAALAKLGAPTPKVPKAVKWKLPKPGTVVAVPDEGERATSAEVTALFEDGAALALLLLGDDSAVQPFPAQLGGAEKFLLQSPEAGATVLFAVAIELTAELPFIAVRHAVLLDAGGAVLSSCRLGAVLIGGGGNTALIPANNLRFEFE